MMTASWHSPASMATTTKHGLRITTSVGYETSFQKTYFMLASFAGVTMRIPTPNNKSAGNIYALIHSDSCRDGALLEHRSIKLSTYGILFMGTPHQGGVELGRVLANLASLSIAADNLLLKHLERDSKWLQQQLGQYAPISNEFVTKFAYEEYSTLTPMGHRLMALIHSDSCRDGALLEHRSIKLSTYGILFMGTPHQGGVELGRVLANLASLSIAADNLLLKHLERDSKWLQQQLGQYAPISNEFVTKFAYEEYSTLTPMGHRLMVRVSPN
ncbi:uncharacterized protein PpBr36_11392 [Pyricularia pennisetigena]|uniref:uncharacterized protein n=1 Tax=Pyricularia pennisetigena TaxID=1578925 RepID=UPI00115221AC|nr:uncharacterized protein PpBr36_11392 [Pyricularia pennisetigena]TLS20345.1 hypothetical protein PpBr36_11392 [Pyricularia pennisetigena]